MDFLVENGAALLFYFFALVAVVGALMVISLRNPMYSAFSLLLTFVAVAALFLLRQAEFLAMVQLFVYGGGIMVLFLFVIMLVNLHKLREVRLFGGHLPFAAVLGVLLIALLGFVFVTASLAPPAADQDGLLMADGQLAGNSQALALKLYRQYLLPFEIVSLFLLVAMIGAVVLGRRH